MRTNEKIDLGDAANPYDGTVTIERDGANKMLLTSPSAGGVHLEDFKLPGGVHAIEDHTDVVITAAAAGEVLRYDGADWVDAVLDHADLGNVTSDQHHAQSHDVDSHSDVTITAAAAGEVMRYSGAAWVDAVLDHADLGNVTSDQHHAQSHDLASHSDVTITAIAAGEIPKWNGAAWVNNTLAEADIFSATDAATHAADTTAIHGITDTADLALKSGNVNQFADITSAGANIEDAVTKRHAEAHTAASHSDVTITGVAANEFLQWNGAAWINRTHAEADLFTRTEGLGHKADIADHTNVTITAAAAGEVLRYSGAAWVDAVLNHADLTGVSANLHHNQIHNYNSHTSTVPVLDIAAAGAGTFALTSIDGVVQWALVP